jgi:sphingolipid delta-4 desaturase
MGIHIAGSTSLGSRLQENPSAHSRDIQRKDAPTRFSFTANKEIHAERRRRILEKYPEIINLYGPDSKSALVCLFTVIVQLFLAFLMRDISSFTVLFTLTYFVSGTLNHSLLLAMHEVTHDLFFKQRWLNQIFSYLANIPMGVPASSMFKLYHADHHTGMGQEGIDTDIPTELEAQLFTGVFGRLIWVTLQPVFYAVRPMVLNPREKSPLVWTVAGMQVLFDIAVLYYFGWKSFFYLFGGTLLGTGLHPMSGHFVAEHFEFVNGQETYSYYGPLNWLTYNVGYHNEHHDFPRISGWRLPMLRKIAPEFYDHLPSYNSWVRVIYDFIKGDNMNLHGRVKRVVGVMEREDKPSLIIDQRE